MGLNMQIRMIALTALLAAPLALGACGKKGNGAPPPGPTTQVDTGVSSGNVANIPSAQHCSFRTLPQTAPGYQMYVNGGFQPIRWKLQNSYVYFWIGGNVGPGYNNMLAQHGYPMGGSWLNGNLSAWPGQTSIRIRHRSRTTIYYPGSRQQPLPSSVCGGNGSITPVCTPNGLMYLSNYDMSGMNQYQIAYYRYNGSNMAFDDYYGYNNGGYDNGSYSSGGYSNTGYGNTGYGNTGYGNGNSNWNDNSVNTTSPSSCRVAQSCIVGADSCGYGTCRPVQPGSNVGICTR